MFIMHYNYTPTTTRESSIVIVSVNTVALGWHTNENILTNYQSPAHTRMSNIEENIGDANIEAALGRKISLLDLTQYPELYMRSSVVVF